MTTTFKYAVTLELPEGMNSNDGRKWLARAIQLLRQDGESHVKARGVRRINKPRVTMEDKARKAAKRPAKVAKKSVKRRRRAQFSDGFFTAR